MRIGRLSLAADVDRPAATPDGASLAASGAAVMTARAFSVVAALAQLPLLTRTLPPQDFALIAAAIATGTFVSLAAAESTTLAFQRFPGDVRDRSTYRFARRRILIGVFLSATVGLTIGFTLGQSQFVIASLGWGIGLAATRFASTAWLMWQRPWRYAWGIALTTGTRTVLLVALVLGGSDAFLAVALAGVASALAVVWTAPSALGARLVSRPWPRYLGLHLGLASAGISVVLNLDRVLLPHLTAPADAGRYAAMFAVASLGLGAILDIATTVLFPRVLHLWDAGSANRIVAARLTDATALATCAVSAAAVGALPFGLAALIDLLTGGTYLDQPVVACLLAATGLFAMGRQAGWILVFRLEARRLKSITLGASAVNIVLILGLVPWLGANGAALASISALVTYAIATQRAAAAPFSTTALSVALFVCGVLPFIVTTGWVSAVAAVVILSASGLGRRYVKGLAHVRRLGAVDRAPVRTST